MTEKERDKNAREAVAFIRHMAKWSTNPQFAGQCAAWAIAIEELMGSETVALGATGRSL